MRAYEEIAADLAHTDRHGVPWPGAARRILIDAAMMLDRLAAVDHLIAQARKVSSSPTMTVYVGDLEAALGRGDRPRGIVGQNGPAAAADAPQPATCEHDHPRPHDYHRPFSNGTRETIRCPGPSPAQPADPPTKERQR